jgi:rubrerythrin
MDEITLETLDRDGALQAALAEGYGETRAKFLAKAALGSAALVGALTAPPAFASSPEGDTRTLNFDLVFEFLQASFYTEAERIGTVRSMPAERQVWARTLGAHERAHVAILKTVLGRAAGSKPTFDFRGVTDTEREFVKTAVAMEDLTVALLSGQAPKLHNRKLVAAVFSLLTVEARHAAWARHLVGLVPVAKPFDEPKTTEQVGDVVASTHFIARRPRTSATGRNPRFTG